MYATKQMGKIDAKAASMVSLGVSRGAARLKMAMPSEMVSTPDATRMSPKATTQTHWSISSEAEVVATSGILLGTADAPNLGDGTVSG